LKIALVLVLALSAGTTAEGATCYYSKLFEKAPKPMESVLIKPVVRLSPFESLRINMIRKKVKRGWTSEEIARWLRDEDARCGRLEQRERLAD
jgi:hypothetical protein